MPIAPLTWLDDFVATITTSGTQSNPRLTQLANGNILLAWDSTETAAGSGVPGTDIYGRLFSPLGLPVSGEIWLGSPTYAEGVERDAALTATVSGGFILAYEDRPADGTSQSIRLLEFDAAASLLNSSQTVIDDTTPSAAPSYNDPQIASASLTSTLIVWQETAPGNGALVRGRLYNPVTDTYGSVLSLIDTGVPDRDPALAALVGGNYVIAAASETAGDFTISYRVISSTGSTVLATTAVPGTGANGQPDLAPAVSALGDSTGDGFVIAWISGTGAAAVVQAQAFSRLGVAEGSLLSLAGAVPGGVSDVSVVGLADEGYLVGYQSLGDGAYKLQAVDRNGTPVGLEYVLATGLDPASVEAIQLADGRVSYSFTDAAGEPRIEIVDPRSGSSLYPVYTPDAYIIGSALNDNLFAGADTVLAYGGDGNDGFYAGGSLTGNSTMDGGAGNDRLYAGYSDNGITYDLASGIISAAGGSVAIASIERIYGGAGSATVIGSAGLDDISLSSAGNVFAQMGAGDDDITTGSAASGGNDTIYGQDGDDRIFSGGGNDTVFGGTGSDDIFSGVGTKAIYGGLGADMFYGSTSSGAFYGDAGDDNFYGASSTASKTVFGGEGDDDFYAGSGFPTGSAYYGGAGTDDFSIAPQGTATTYDFVNGRITDNVGGQMIFIGFEELSATSATGASTVIGSAGVETVRLGSGGGLVQMGGGNDSVYAGAGVDTVYGGEGDDRIFSNLGADSLYGDAGNDMIYGGSTAYGGDGNDRLDGGSNSATFYGDAGDDYLYLGSGNLLAFGGVGTDRIYSGTGTDFLYGGADNDDFYSGAGNDSVYGGDGNDQIRSGDGNDLLDGGTGNDSMFGGNGSDRYIVDSTLDAINFEPAFSAGGGIDTVEASATFTLPANVEVLRLQGTSNINGFGNDAPESIVGNPGGNLLVGNGGNDVLNGKAGDDTIDGGTGRDTLVGEDGADVFLYDSLADSYAGSTTRDFLNGFTHGTDRIDLSAIDANPFQGGDQAFTFIGNAAFTGAGAASAGQLRFFTFGGGNLNILEADWNGDGVPELQVFINGTNFMTGTDFIL
jgi:Ca2+-binding RTX toxin-like protein